MFDTIHRERLEFHPMAKRIPEHPFVVEVRGKLAKCRGFWPQIVEKSGVSHSWISQFSRQIITNPTIQNLQEINRACDDVLDDILRESRRATRTHKSKAA